MEEEVESGRKKERRKNSKRQKIREAKTKLTSDFFCNYGNQYQ